MQLQRMCIFCGVTAALVIAWPSLASAAGAATGIAAGLGLTAASGKTTMAGGAGSIEATLLTSDAIMAAGREIRTRAANAADGKPLIVIGRSDTLDLASASWVSSRIRILQREVDGVDPAHCSDAAPAPLPHGGGQRQPLVAGESLQASPADITAALATDVSISPITVSVDDRLLINAVAAKAPPTGWVALGTPDGRATSSAQEGTAFVPGEIVDVAPGNELLARYEKLQQTNDGLAKCTSAPAKAVISNVGAFVTTMSSASKGQAPIMLAAELFAIEQNSPVILRVAIEQAGGTAITRSNIWYTLGWPGQATISSGLLASYRLTDPSSGTVLAQGLVRCLTKPKNFSDVDKSLQTSTKQVCQVAPS